MPFRWTVNPYRGCAMGCRYCYATYTHEFMGIAHPRGVPLHGLREDRRHEARTAADLARLVRKRERIAVGAATDPYQPGEAEARVTRRFLEAWPATAGRASGITTKGALVLRDLDLLRRIERAVLAVRPRLAHLPARRPAAALEPWAPPPEVRIEVMRRLTEAGIETWLGLAPVLPGHHGRASATSTSCCGRVAAAGVRRLFSQRAVPALADAREVPALAGGRVPALPGGLRERLSRAASTWRAATASGSAR